MAKRKNENGAKKRSAKEVGRSLIQFGVIFYFIVIYATCHMAKIDLSDLDSLVNNLLSHILHEPFGIFPLNWKWIGIVTFFYLLAFAGVTCDNIGEYISAGAIGAGIGSELISLKAINAGDFNYVTNKAKALLSAVKAVK